ncbi:MAG: hypothetical protein LBG96_11170 [Tannerella sp.]|jgi:hypothetical protein|nr:hypothetical protein [Tannerella sp.]
MDGKEMKIQDDTIRKLFSGTKIKAGGNLKYRIMQQIETESALSIKKSKSKSLFPLIGNMLSVFGVMYALIALAAMGIILMGGIETLQSLTFFVPVTMIASVCGLFLMISIYDDKRRWKHFKEN